jgi:sec-independent protein translocase protein TatB
VLIALVVLGPDKLPDAMRKAGKMYADFKKMTSGFQSEMKSVLEEPMRELRETADLVKQSAMIDPNEFMKPLTGLLDGVKNMATEAKGAPAPKAEGAPKPEDAPVAATPVEPAPSPEPAPLAAAVVVPEVAVERSDEEAAVDEGAAADMLGAATPPSLEARAAAERALHSLEISQAAVASGAMAGFTPVEETEPTDVAVDAPSEAVP